MTPEVTQAVQQARALDAQAAAGWPMGYRYADVFAEATRLLAVLSAYATTPERSRALLEALR